LDFLTKLRNLNRRKQPIEAYNSLFREIDKNDIPIRSRHFMEVVDACGKVKEYERALNVVLVALESKVGLTTHDIQTGITIANRSNDMEAVMKMKEYAISNHKTDLVTYNLLLEALSNHNRFEAVICEFEGLAKIMQPSTFAYLKFIIALRKTGKLKDCFETAKYMKASGVPVSSKIYEVLIKASFEIDQSSSFDVLKEAVEENSDAVANNLFVLFMTLCEKFDSIENVDRIASYFKNVNRTIQPKVYYQLCMTFGHFGMMQRCANLYLTMLADSKEIDHVSVLSMLSSSNNINYFYNVLESIQVFGMGKKDVALETAKFHCSIGNFEQARNLIEFFDEKFYFKTFYNEWIIDVFEICASFEMAEQMSKLLLNSRNVLPLTFEKLLEKCQKLEKGDLMAVGVFKAILKSKLIPTDLSFEILLSVFMKMDGDTVEEHIGDLYAWAKSQNIDVSGEVCSFFVKCMIHCSKDDGKIKSFYEMILRDSKDNQLPKSIPLAVSSYFIGRNKHSEAVQILERFLDENSLPSNVLEAFQDLKKSDCRNDDAAKLLKEYFDTEVENIKK